MTSVILEKSKSITKIILNKPPLNVMDIPMMEELVAAFNLLKEDRATKVVVIAAQGKAFSAGTDIKDHYPDRAREMIENFHAVFHALWSLEQPIVAAVRGAALGGGCELAIACDFIIASERATFGQPEIKVGAFAPIGSLLLPHMIGGKKAYELLLTGETIDAREAERIGIVNCVLPDESFDAGVDEFVGKLLALSGVALRHAKRAAQIGSGKETSARLAKIEQVYLSELIRTQDAVEGLDAFLQKRKPNWKEA